MNTITTLTEFILKEERRYKNATGSFTLLLTHIENAAKIIASHIKRTGLVDILGKTGAKNVYYEDVQKLDEFSNKLLVDLLSESGQVGYLASEELPEAIEVDKKGQYNIFFDPLDGSSNIDTNISIGTIFSIYHNDGNLLKPGKKQVASGYIIYGSSVMFVYTFGNGVNGFTLDPGIGSFLLSRPNIKIPDGKTIYSINEGYYNMYESSTRKYLDTIKKEENITARYVGSMVADIHRTLIKGGIFLYPRYTKKPNGHIRLMFEINPLAFIIGQAGGMAVSDKKNPLDITPQKLEQRAPIVMGSKNEVEKYLEYC